MFVLWAVYGVVPTIHWVCLQQGGPIVGYMIPRIFVMYAMCGAAFFFYLTKVPERLIPGLVDTFGHSHQVCQTIMLNTYLQSFLSLFLQLTKLFNVRYKISTCKFNSSSIFFWQWWHVLIFFALLFWHQTGLKFALFRLKHGCIADGQTNRDIIQEDDLNELAISFWPI